MDSALATAENWHLKGLTFNIKMQVLKQHLLETITTELINRLSDWEGMSGFQTVKVGTHL
jgi:hypothetical protein